jgi:ribosomal protein S18 acetylase RimI-like enzyme
VELRLRPLRDEEFPEFLEFLRREYVRGLVDDAGLTREAAEQKATADHAAAFPGGNRQAQHRIYLLEDAETDERVGHLFWAPRRPPGSTTDRAYLYELFIVEALRGQGFGRQAMELFEAQARDEGLPGVDLNVWGRNEPARALYRSLGFAERSVMMSKELA